MNDLTEAALGYLEQGHHLIALTHKRPSTKYHARPDEETAGWSWDRSIHGIPEPHQHWGYDYDMNCETCQLTDVFEDPTTTGVAILIPEHYLVADVDTEDAAVLFDHLTKDDPDRYETRVAKTTKGLHIWYFAPGASQSMWVGGRTLLFKGLGGYVAAPPSRHFDEDGVQDGVYTWLTATGYAFLPDGIAAYLAKMAADAQKSPMRAYETEVRHMKVEMVGDGPWSLIAGTILLVRDYQIEGLCKAIREAPDGNQNNMIAWASMQARDEGVPYDVAMPQLLEAAVQGGHPRERALTTIKGAFTRRHRG